MKTEGLELIRRLSLAFGPTGYTDEVLAIVREELEGIAPAETDRMNVLTVKIPGGGDGYDPANPKKVLFSAHADEVGFLIVGIDDGGYLYFRPVGGIDAKVLCGRSVLVGEHKIPGVISAKAIHHMSGDERKKVFEAEDLYINIGAADKADAEKYVSVGDYAAFDSEFVRFGEDGKYIKCKALDDRLGCAVMIEAIRRMKREKLTVPYDLYFAFTDGEEIGCSLAKTTANRISPDFAVILETTAIADLPGTPDAKKVAFVGNGGVMGFMDRGTIYPREVLDFAFRTAEKHGIAAQTKHFVSGGNDAGVIHKTGTGVRVLNISCATRYLHGPALVESVADCEAIRDLVYAIITDVASEGGLIRCTNS